MISHLAMIMDGNRRWAKKRGFISSIYTVLCAFIDDFCEKWDSVMHFIIKLNFIE